MKKSEKESTHKYTRVAYKGYSQMIFCEFPELTNVCLAFYNYTVCSFAVCEDKKRVRKELEKFRSRIVSEGLLEKEDRRWQYVLENRTHCMEHTAAICKLVEKTVKTLEKNSKAGDAEAIRALRTITTYYGVPTSQQRFAKRSPNHVVDAFHYIYELYGEQYDSLFAEVHAPIEHAGDLLYDIFSYSDFYHHTRDLLSYYKQYTVDRVHEELSPSKQDETDAICELMGTGSSQKGKSKRKTAVAHCAALLVEMTLNSLKTFNDPIQKIDGTVLYRALDQHYLSDVNILEAIELSPDWDSSNTAYRKREQALRTYSAILWGYHTLNVIEILEESPRIKKQMVSSDIFA